MGVHNSKESLTIWIQILTSAALRNRDLFWAIQRSLVEIKHLKVTHFDPIRSSSCYSRRTGYPLIDDRELYQWVLREFPSRLQEVCTPEITLMLELESMRMKEWPFTSASQ